MHILANLTTVIERTAPGISNAERMLYWGMLPVSWVLAGFLIGFLSEIFGTRDLGKMAGPKRVWLTVLIWLAICVTIPDDLFN